MCFVKLQSTKYLPQMVSNSLICAVFLLKIVVASERNSDVDFDKTFHTWAEYSDFEMLDTGDWGYVKYSKQSETLCLNCNNIDDIKPFKAMLHLKNLIISCSLPTKPIKTVLEELNINSTSINMLKITLKTKIKPGNYTTGLTIRTLWIYALAYGENVLEYNPDFYQPLDNLTTLMVSSMNVSPMPPNVHLKVLWLNNFASVSSWGNCEYLEDLRMESIYPENIPSEWPEKCSLLTSLRMRSMKNGIHKDHVNRVSNNLSNAFKSLRLLHINDSWLHELPMKQLVKAKDSLLELHLPNNQLYDNLFADFPNMDKLTSLNLSNNSLVGWFLYDLVKKIPALQNLVLDGNSLTNYFCKYEKQSNFLTGHLTSLEALSLNLMNLSLDCFAGQRFAKLKYLSQANTTETSFLMSMLPLTNSTHLEVDFRSHVTMKILYYMTKYRYEKFIEDDPSALWLPGSNPNYDGTNYTLLFNVIDCECIHYWLARALGERDSDQRFLSLPGVRCAKSQREFKNEPLQTMDCYKTWRDHCSITEEGAFGKNNKKGRVEVECNNFQGNLLLPRLDEFQYIYGLNASRNMLSTIRNISSLPETIEWLDLRDNKMTNINENDSALLFANPKRRVWLTGNEFRCTCENRTLIDSLHKHQNQVVDFDDIICIDTGLPLYLTFSHDVCQITQKISLGSAGSIIAVILIAASIIWRYRFQIRIYLYSRGLCLFCLREEDLDTGKIYDAFLSFAHKDYEFVMENLLPRLEGEPDHYRICIHYRDWVVGDWIPTQIMRSVQESKRTIVVLSKNFLTSLWGTLEFRYAVGNAIEENRSRLLVLIVGDVLSENLSPELKGYIATHTYLHCDDPWFWDKLRYAMPHRPPVTVSERTEEVISDLVDESNV